MISIVVTESKAFSTELVLFRSFSFIEDCRNTILDLLPILDQQNELIIGMNGIERKYVFVEQNNLLSLKPYKQDFQDSIVNSMICEINQWLKEQTVMKKLQRDCNEL